MASHLKRLVAPKTWPIVRKTTKFIARPKPSGQRIDLTVPVVVAMRELLGLVTTSKEARRVLQTQTVTVNGHRVHDVTSAVGFMDVLAILEAGKGWRVLINEHNSLVFVPVRKEEDFIIQKISGKTVVRGAKTQLHFTSGRNLLVGKDEYKVGDSVALGRDGKIAHHYKLENGASVLLTGGSHIGKAGTVERLHGNVITIKTDDATFETDKRHAYVIGKGKPAITLHG